MRAGDTGAAAIVTTLRNADSSFQSFIEYHRAIGFAHIYLIFDDPADPDLERARATPDVTAIPCDDALRAAWRSLPLYPVFGETADAELMSRQTLNVQYAMTLARDAGFAWLLHIDSDELFYAPGMSAPAHFADLSASPYEAVRYLNWEAIPEREEIGDFFREVDLFKPNAGWVEGNRRAAMQEAVRTTPQLDPFFHLYVNGKSAVRLAAPGVAPAGVHSFGRAGGTIMEATAENVFILHYPCCGFEAFWTKYSRPRAFGDKWWGKVDIRAAIGPFPIDARAAVAEGREAAREFYFKRLAITDPAKVEELIWLGLAVRVAYPRQILTRSAAAGGTAQRYNSAR